MQLKKTFNNTICKCIIKDEIVVENKARTHSIIHVFTGKIIINCHGKEIIVCAGETIFIKRNNWIQYIKYPETAAPYEAIRIFFEYKSLRTYYNNNKEKERIKTDTKTIKEVTFKLSSNIYWDSLFLSLNPFFESQIEPLNGFVEIKIQEAIFHLLNSVPQIYPVLFDFNEPWKIDLLEFMEQNYTQDLTLQEFASYTGRSLATFKRDFAKISNLPPQKWITIKRLETAYRRIRDNHEKVSEVAIDVGFKNRSHFSVVFSKYYGFPPSKIKKELYRNI